MREIKRRERNETIVKKELTVINLYKFEKDKEKKR